MLSELGGLAAHSGLLTIGPSKQKGRFSPDQVVAEIRDRRASTLRPLAWSRSRTRTTAPAARLATGWKSTRSACRANTTSPCTSTACGLKPQPGVDSARIGRGFDTVTPVFQRPSAARSGALIAVRSRMMTARARAALLRRRDAPGRNRRGRRLYSARPPRRPNRRRPCTRRRLAEGPRCRWSSVDLDQVERTHADRRRAGPGRCDRAPEGRWSLVSTTVHPSVVRAVTHLDIPTTTSTLIGHPRSVEDACRSLSRRSPSCPASSVRPRQANGSRRSAPPPSGTASSGQEALRNATESRRRRPTRSIASARSRRRSRPLRSCNRATR